ncbi:MAG: HlyD family efflux transporter periplasmic adaptor subunit [Bacteroidales bacterium]|nr:HlyD family efflux transporter periplasmic adaptor subunit [Bacteroidales bacterium]
MKYVIYSLLLLMLVSCKNGGDEADAYGNFQAVEILISSESAGKILAKHIREGDQIKAGQLAYLVDTTQVYLKRVELEARKRAVFTKKLNLNAQVSVLKEQKTALDRDIARLEKMLKEGASSQKQVDDLHTQYAVLTKQIQQVESNFSGITAEAEAIDAGILQVEDQLSRARVIVPINGSILETYAEQGESVAPGKPLFKVANLDTLEMKAYFSAKQLTSVKLGQEVKVLVDNDSGGMKTLKGKVCWIASNAEFTPKIIQTKEERVNLVYAVKIRVPNDGSLRINMPGEVKVN